MPQPLLSLADRPNRAAIARRFWSFVPDRPEDPDACWLWTGMTSGRDDWGYFYLSGAHKHMPAHRVAYLLTHESIEPHMIVRQTCQVPLCMRPSHLVALTWKDDMRDRPRHKRLNFSSCPRGEAHPRSRLTTAEVLEIRRLCALGILSYAALGRRYGVDGETIRVVALRKTWAHL